MPPKKRPSRKDRDASLKRGPKNLIPFMEKGQEPDAIVIGSGIGGLTCAAFLGRAGKRVLVLEQHDTAGGCLHSYAAGGYEWDVGIHYVGEVGGPGVHRAILEQLTRGQLEWSHQGDPYDVAYLPLSDKDGNDGRWEAFKFVQGLGRNEEMLCARFPAEKAAVQAFFRDMKKQMAGALFIVPKLLPKCIARLVCPILDVFNGFYTRLATPLTEALDKLGVQDPLLRAALTYPWGDLGNTPATLPYGIMLGLHAHFQKDGGFFPVGGAASISYCLVETILAQGGDVLTRVPVREILVEGNKAYGVVLESGKKVVVSCKDGNVISAVSYQTLYDKLLPRSAVPRPLAGLQDGGCMREGMAAMSLFVGLEGSPSELGLNKIQENAWAFSGACFETDFAKFLAQSRDDVLASKLPWPGVFVGFPSSKDPAWNEDFKGKSSVTVISFVNWSWFADYEKTRVHKRGSEYDHLKDHIAKRMWEFTCKVYPQLKNAKVGHFEAGTPLSNNYYIGSNKGEIYGADHNADRFALHNLIAARPDVTGITNLVVAGQDNLCGGFAGGLFGGCLGAGTALGSSYGLWLGMLYSGFRYIPGFTP
eukprot:TRINITY_DN94654_c0_g1_i1.p1 TRINITY_DN94654_c0_g1~~TRINITY_DN94654_c0_g1_i1.p1  ORF type:complete len:661 (+),score=74.62 TRINITY_DN94654_c0_g1_i1:214-1983(+)